MNKREWLAHHALRVTVDALNEPQNTGKLAAMDDALGQLCPECEYGILYCRCFERVDLSIASTKNRNERR